MGDKSSLFDYNYTLGTKNGHLYLGFRVLPGGNRQPTGKFTFISNPVFEGIWDINGDLNVNTVATFNLAPKFRNQRLTEVGTPTEDTDATNKVYVDNVRLLIQSLELKANVKVATLAPLSLTWTGTYFTGLLHNYDSVPLFVGDRILVWKEAIESRNGIYVVGSSRLSRASDADSTSKLKYGTNTVVNSGTYSGKKFVLTTPPAILDSTPLIFTESTQSISEGGAELILDDVDPGLKFNGNKLRVGGNIALDAGDKFKMGATEIVANNGSLNLKNGSTTLSISPFSATVQVDNFSSSVGQNGSSWSLLNIYGSKFRLRGVTNSPTTSLLTLDGQTYINDNQLPSFPTTGVGKLKIVLNARTSSNELLLMQGTLSWKTELSILTLIADGQNYTSSTMTPPLDIVTDTGLITPSWNPVTLVASNDRLRIQVTGLVGKIISWFANVQVTGL